MFKKSLLIIAVLLVSVGFVSAQTTDKPAETAQPVLTDQNTQIHGTIVKIDHKKMMMTVKDEVSSEEKDFTFTDTTSFSKDEKTITHKELKKGDRVLLELDSTNNLLRVTIEPKESIESDTEKKPESEKPE